MTDKFKLAPFRDATRVFNVPEPDHSYFAEFVHQLFSSYKMVVIVGMPCCGKSALAEAYRSKTGTHTLWSRENIFSMLFAGGERDEKYNSHIESFEYEVFPSLLGREYHQVIVDGLNRMPSRRKKLIGLNEMHANMAGPKKICAVVFDGPKELIVERMKQSDKYSGLDEFEMEQMVERMKTTTVWPKFTEGFDSIYCVNTFGEAGAQSFNTVVTKRTK